MKTHTQLAKWFFATLLFSTLVLVFPNSPAADLFEDGVQAHKVGDYKKALEIFKPLAEQEISKAQYRLGIMYAKGRGVPQDYKEAVKWYRKATEHGYFLAQNYLGIMYKNGHGVPQDYKEAVKWFRKAAKQGHYPEPQYNLGRMYDNGQGVEQGDLEAYKWFSLALVHSKSLVDLVKYKVVKMVAGFTLDSAQKKEADEWVKNWKPQK